MTVTCALNDVYIYGDSLHVFMRLSTYALVLCEHSSISSSLAIAIDHRCNYTSEGGVRSQFWTEPKVKMEHYDIIRRLNNYVGGKLLSDILY